MQKEISILLNDCLQYFSRHNYTQHRIDKYKMMWKHGILKHMSSRGMSLYEPGVGQDYLHTLVRTAEEMTPANRDRVRSISVLDDYLTTGTIRKKTHVAVEYPLDGTIGEEMQKLINHLQTLRRSATTIRDYKMYLNRFLHYLDRAGVSSAKAIREEHLLKFLSTSENNKINIASTLRVLFSFWYETHVTDKNPAESLHNYKWEKTEKIPSFYTPEEVVAIEKSVDRGSSIGKRNYAMLLFATRLGLRASDIVAMKFSNLEWEKNEIRLTQCKTGNPILLPLLGVVGNAVIDYLRHGRFKSETQNVFLSCRAPYRPVTRSMVCSALNRIISESGVPVDGRRHGPHSMLHSLASCLLGNETPVPVISGVLGHAKTATTMTYLRIDLASLQKCALEVPPVTEEFYMQKGGMFYE